MQSANWPTHCKYLGEVTSWKMNEMEMIPIV